MKALISAHLASMDKTFTKPPMGWSTWNVYRCEPSIDIYLDIIAMVNNGLQAAGYNHIIIEDGW